MKTYNFPSGAQLKISLASFEDGKELYQVIAKELKELKIDENEEIGANLFKDIFFTALASKEIEKAILKCSTKALYNGSKINSDTFEPEEARQDYIECLYLIAEENLRPFGKALYAKYGHIFQEAMGASKQG